MRDTVLVYDDDCGFCTWWAEFFDERSDVPIVGFSDLESDLEDRLPEDYERCSHLLTPEARYSCGASIEETFARSSVGRPLRPLVDRLRRYDTYTTLREGAYRRIAHNRAVWGRVLSKTPPAREGESTEASIE
ncbi:DCC1-like thiol-disulfide oxidoreductase family protein [Natrarchaeobius chitinivorans]|uniref:DUF393 domain-containing protein n=1 Tax=Natrarchaeobius chitinivorans TaxID=1679083 RepID=A0A3N6MAX7_NATCH|nr:DCC1-like thiol-disulfide oxidoreductase family protein [Natrarchaeobius chitinivorans]RQG93540.1 DUF393 domain-containing protein [Natrarchaeobius chitinivorans]